MSADIAEIGLEANDSDPFACYGTDSEYEPSNSSSSGPLKPTSSPKNQNTRKTERNINSWRRVESKCQKNSGKQYTIANGQLIPSKLMKSECRLKCHRKCHERVPHDVRLDVFNNYYKLGNKERQWDFVAKGVKVIDKKVTKISTSSRRNASRLYYLNYYRNDKYESTRVCLKMFLDTIAVSSQIVDTALRKYELIIAVIIINVLFTFYSWISKKLKVYIQHKFLEKGHTQNEGDSMHSPIEKCRKNKTIYIPAQYYSLIRNAKISGSTYMLHELEQNEMNFI